MNSSDSEADFESADEDLDINKPLEKKLDEKVEVFDEEEKVLSQFDEEEKVSQCDKGVKVSQHNEKKSNESNLLEEISGKISRNLEQVQLKEEVINTFSRSKTNPDQAIEPINLVSPRSEELKSKQSVKKLGTKLTNDSVKHQKESEIQPKQDIHPMKDNVGSDIKPLQNKITEEIRNKVEVDANADEDLFQVNKIKNIKTEEYLENNESRSNHINNIKVESDTVASQSIKKSEDINFEAGDGWELEEEDGFEIPMSLAKNSDDGIKCAQEQICELDQVEFRPPKTEQEPSWGGWGGWGVSSLLSTATDTVSTFSSHVTSGLSTVLETTVGAPDPTTEHAPHRKETDEGKEEIKTEEQSATGYSGLGSIVSGVSFLGSSVINRGLDTLETIGKKTMEVLQEGDPGLKKKRALLFQNDDKPILSQILREAKERADNSDKEKEEKDAARKIHFESLFDDFQGMVHLEALEMLSTQCELKLQSLLQAHSGAHLLDLQETLSQVRDLCELAEEEEETEALTVEQFAEKVTTCVEDLRIKLTPTKIIKVNAHICECLENLNVAPTAAVVNQTAISSLAELTAAAMEFYHKSAELIMAKLSHNTADEAESYVQLTNHLCARISAVANEFTQLLTKNDPIANSSLITNIFLEASNSCSYTKNACQLLVPILQVGAVTS